MQKKQPDATSSSVQENAAQDPKTNTNVAGDPAGTKAGQDATTPPEPPVAEPEPEPPATPPADGQEDGQSVDDGKTPPKRGPGRPPKISPAVDAAAGKIVKLALDKLLAHPRNEKLFGATSPNELAVLAESMRQEGQGSPLLVTAHLEKSGYYTLLNGHKRALALQALGRQEAHCQVVDVKDADEQLLFLLEANRQHVPSTEQKIRIAEVYFELEKRMAKVRQIAGAKAKKAGAEVVETLTPPAQNPAAQAGGKAKGKARDLAAAMVDLSGVSFDEGRKALRAAEKAQEEGKPEVAAKLLELLNEKGIHPACEHAKALGLIKSATISGDTRGEVTEQNKGQTKEADNPQQPASTTIPPGNNGAAPSAPTAGTNAEKVDPPVESANGASGTTGQPDSQPKGADADDEPPVVGIIAASNKLLGDLAELEVPDLSITQKDSLYRALDLIADWLANHGEMLGGLRQG